MDFLIIAIGIILIIIGFVGCVVPVIPGPPIAYLSLIGLLFSKNEEMIPDTKALIIFGVISVFITILDFVIPAVGTKKSGGTKAGTIGSTIGIVAGIFILPPIGIILGPFVGAMLGELVVGASIKRSLKSGLGSFLGFLAGTFIKILNVLAILIYFLIIIF